MSKSKRKRSNSRSVSASTPLTSMSKTLITVSTSDSIQGNSTERGVGSICKRPDFSKNRYVAATQPATTLNDGFGACGRDRAETLKKVNLMSIQRFSGVAILASAVTLGIVPQATYAIDTDNDGIDDVVDLDSDNDGIPDSIERVVAEKSYIDWDGVNDYNARSGTIIDPKTGNTVNVTFTAPLWNFDFYTSVWARYFGIDGFALEHTGVRSENGDNLVFSFDQPLENVALQVWSLGASTNPVTFTIFGDGQPLDLNARTVSDSDPVYTSTDNQVTGNEWYGDIETSGSFSTLNLQVSGQVRSDAYGFALVSVAYMDSDSDGTPDYMDTDSDGDGIDDSVEGSVDTDGDSIPDYLDTDSDDDGIDDSVEGSVDTDSDSISDYLDTDSDDDGIDDIVEGVADAEGDSTPNYRDLDSDGDGIDDSIEGTADTDGDTIPDYLDTDSDSDGIDDIVEGVADTDGDSTPNYRDLDSDGDGIDDSIEGTADTDGDLIPGYVDTDSDGDGIDDVDEGVADTDGDLTPDYLDTDSDNDGIPDVDEGSSDSDGNGIPDYLDADSDYDNDGLSNQLEGAGDTDGDGVIDALDQDSDDDGIPDSVEGEFEGEIPADRDGDGVFDYLDIDADNDGISDAVEGMDDRDQDGVANFRDLDGDNDGIFDLIEARIGLAEVNQLDTDLNGVIDQSFSVGANGMADTVEETADSGVENYTLSNIDGDQLADYADLDSDNDGLFDTLESDHPDSNMDGIIDSSIVASDDRSRSVAAVSSETGLADGAGGTPRNTDGDTLADFRDGDSDNDGVPDAVESFGVGSDTNNDGYIDGFTDNNDDGADDNMQASPVAPKDVDGDGAIDAIEIDADADGIPDLVEAGGTDVDGNGLVDGFLDDDYNGIDDGVQAVPYPTGDTDGDGNPDFQDTDSDNDGLSDLQESGGTDANGDGQADGLVNVSGIPDEDGNGVPDYQQGGAGNGNPNVLPAKGLVTGLQGGGCVFVGESRAVDPLLPALMILALLGLARRCRQIVVDPVASVFGQHRRDR